ncbi:hypothetical protein SO694_000313101 [Aureococcus anophagefferens]|uniref:SAM domain-containing protein n=1 Tax=Aureococcus anophagefferens TaxID=44056 RepID=A0ABR1FJR4_AURAN
MSDKLNALRAQMSREKQKREAAETTRGVGGARWGSSGGDRGGIRAYGREAREKAGATNRAPPGRGQRAPRGRRRAPGRRAAPAQGLRCLQGLLVPARRRANEIGGAELLDLGLDDLDYLEIKALAHRKKLLKGSRSSTWRTGTASPSTGPPPPLAETQVSGGALDVNGGDRAPRGLLDGAGAAGGWSNPADLDVGGGSSLLLDEQAEQEAFKRAVEEWRSGGKENVAAESPTKPAFAPEQSLLNGTFDEAAEQRSFKEAVMSWRTGGDSPPKQAPPVARVASGDGSPSKLGKSAREVAEDLERRLDALHAAQARDLQDRKDAAAKKLAAATLEADEPAPAPDVAEESDDDLALDPADASDYEEDDDDEPVLHQSAHVSLVASQLGCSADAEDLGYVVEEEDD